MAYSYTEKKRIRKDFGKLPHVMDVPYPAGNSARFLQKVYSGRTKALKSVWISVCKLHSGLFSRLPVIPAMLRWSM